MPHDVPLISTLAAAFGLALVLGYLAVRLRLPALVGYLVAGVAIGPATPGFVADIGLANQLSEIGVMLLMFGVGLHFSLGDLLAVKRIALPGALVQILVATGLGAIASRLWGWSWGAGLVFGLALSVASTVVLLRALESRGLLDSVNGKIAVGWLVVEDLVMVLVLVLLPPLAGWLGGSPTGAVHGATGEGTLVGTLLATFGLITLFVVLMFVVGRRVFPWLLWQVARSGSRELFTLCVIAAAVGIAYAAAKLFGVSFALGAFVAGMVLRESALSQRAAEESLPMREAFAVLFFVAVGMLFDPMVVVEQPLRVVVAIAIVLVGKSLAATAIVLLSGYPLNTALTVSAGLAQVGEFSFILAAMGVSLGLLPVEGQSLVLAAALGSIAINHWLFAAIEPLQRFIRARSARARELERRTDPLAVLPDSVDAHQLTSHVTLVGYGRVGRRLSETLAGQGLAFVVAEANRELVEELRLHGVSAVSGNASEPAVLIQAHVARAKVLVIATPDAFAARKMIETARLLNPTIHIVARVHSDEEAELLRADGANEVLIGEHELADAMSDRVLRQMVPDAASTA